MITNATGNSKLWSFLWVSKFLNLKGYNFRIITFVAFLYMYSKTWQQAIVLVSTAHHTEYDLFTSLFGKVDTHMYVDLCVYSAVH